ncbi:hypothetical protein GCM10007916_20970 [Psychromonas marina]|uniref:histidine kinase n=1 Tax=Psychromonas marina TaxID=88364 RepID=A0ABQ6E1A9_9GAMM|nr:hypothetical protein GCM10007916_20970 [Psychromonas marina]
MKIYFIVMMLITGVTTISIMSLVSINSFFEGIDFAMADAMRSQANKHPVRDGHPIRVNNFTIATQWVDLPAPIRDNLNQADLEDNELLKLINGTPLLSKPESGFFAMRVNQHGNVRYISSMFTPERPMFSNDFRPPPPQKPRIDSDERMSTENDRPTTPPTHEAPQFDYIIVIGLIAIILFSLVPYLILRKVTTPVEKLMLWANKLDKENLAQPIPDFHYSELNSLATMMKVSLKSVQEALAREQRFLGYASHELRTPIAVARSNSELLRKMIEKNIAVDKQEQVINRIERACLTMTDLTETLLWLNRKLDKSIPIKPVSLGALTQQLLEDLAYLQTDKTVLSLKEVDQNSYPLPEPLCRIIITNLLRNAIQHTQQGFVTIKQSKTTIVISNKNIQEGINGDQAEHSELGFGLGLKLTERLVKQYGWSYSNIATDTGHNVVINFCCLTK